MEEKNKLQLKVVKGGLVETVNNLLHIAHKYDESTPGGKQEADQMEKWYHQIMAVVDEISSLVD